MKFTHFLLAAAVCATTAASAQTVPTTTAPRGTGAAAPSAVPSGTPAPAANPKGAVSAGEVFTTGSPDGTKSSKRMKQKDTMSKGHDHSIMKTKAE
jgi:hypothetical protein